MKRRKTFAILAAGGKSKRMGVDKLFLPIAGMPILYKTLSTLLSCRYVDGCIIAVNPASISRVRKYINFLKTEKEVSVIKGGDTRERSVYNALNRMPQDTDFVIVHDAARPLVSEKLLNEVIKSTYRYRAVIPAVDMKSTIKEISRHYVKNTLDRKTLVDVQTPQGFEFKTLKQAYNLAGKENLTTTDDSLLVERLKIKVRVIKGEYKNIKITTPEDYTMAKALCEPQDIKVGFGYDVHKIATGRPLMLGCVKIPSSFGLQGHSDADVVAHSITDAILGALCESDIGGHFPNTPKWKGLSGEKLLKCIYRTVKSKGFKLCNIDCTVVLEKPNISFYKNKMRQQISKILGLSFKSINVKATTSEGLGFIGKGEGASCYAVAMLKKEYGNDETKF